MSIESMTPSKHLTLCYPRTSPSPILNLSSIRVFLISWFLASGGQSTGASASASVLPMNIQGWFTLGWTVLILCCPRDPQESSADIYFPAELLLHLSIPSRLNLDQFSLSPIIKQFECLSLIRFSNGNHRSFPHCIFNKNLFSNMLFEFRSTISWPSLWIADFSHKRL